MTIAPDLQTNPLINPPKLRNDAPPLDAVRTEHFLPAFEFAIAKTRAEIEAIKNNPDVPTFENTILAYEYGGQDLARVSGVFSIISGTKSDAEIEALEIVIGQKLSAFGSDISFDLDLFKRIKAVHDDPASQNLGPQEQRLLNKLYNGYVRSGALLDDASKNRLREIDQTMSDLTTAYGNNVKSSKKEFKHIADVADLKGLPDDVIASMVADAKKDGQPDGKAVIRLNNAAYDVIEFADNRDLRRLVQAGFRNVANGGQFDNGSTGMEIIKLRHERAQLLGYQTHAEYVLDDRMAKTPKTVEDFLEKNLALYKPTAEAELQQIKDYALQKGGITDFKPWDTGYYSRLLKEELFKVDMKEVRAYYSLDNIIKGFHEHLEKAFGVELREEAYPVHKKDVRAYEAFNKASGAFLGLFYTNYTEDQDAKSTKRGGAWMDAYRVRADRAEGVTYPIITNDCNYPRQEEGEPSPLLDQGENETVRHEGGHGMHGLLGKGKYPSLNGTNVLWDWVEVPSQLQENWVNQKEVLKGMLRHCDTGQPIPDDLVDKLIAMKNFGAGMMGLRQTNLGMLDMRFHNTDPALLGSMDDVEKDINAKASISEAIGSVARSFTHIFSGGYSSGYYSYKWAEVLEADIFSLFVDNGLYHQDSLDRVRHYVYESGNTAHPADLFRDLMGRDPDPEALFRREGLLPPKAAVAPAPAPANTNTPGPFPKAAP